MFAERNRLDVGAGGDHGENDISGGTKRCRRRRYRQVEAYQCLGPPRPDPHIVAGRLEMKRHRASHHAQTDEADLHAVASP